MIARRGEVVRNPASTEGRFDTDFYGNAKCGGAPDIGAVGLCENAATKAKSDETAQ